MQVIDLKENNPFIEQYVNLRNSYADLLISSEVNLSETKEWFSTADIEIKGLVEDDTLLGVVILYLKRDGEIAFFVKDKNKGIGTKLVNIIEKVAREKKLNFIRGWVLIDNMIARRVFEKSGFIKEGTSKREYKDTVIEGVKYKKYLNY